MFRLRYKSAGNSDSYTFDYDNAEYIVHFELLPGDVDDNKFVDCAIASNAELIVTNDKDFDPLKSIDWPKVEVMTIQDFMGTWGFSAKRFYGE